MAYIQTKYHSLEILVDDDKLEELSQYKWRIDSNDYALAQINGKTVKMDRYLTNCPKNMRVLHRNFKPLDMRLENLEVMTFGELKKRYSEFYKSREYDASGIYLVPYNRSIQRDEEN